MRKLLGIMILTILTSCKADFAKEKYDVLLTFRNETQEKILLGIVDTNNKFKWDKKTLLPEQTVSASFNIKQDIGVSEGGFILKAYFENGDSTSLNTGYFTNFQLQGKNPQNFSVTKLGFKIL